MTARPNPDMLTVQEAADIMRVSKMTTYRLIHSGDLLAFRIGHSIRIRRSDLNYYLNGAAVEVER